MKQDKIIQSLADDRLIKSLKKGGVAVLATDTIYGVVASAYDAEAVARIYRLKKRNPKKPSIVLIATTQDISRFNVRVAPSVARFLRGVWPGRVSVALSTKGSKFKYLHCGTGYIAFRVPLKKALRELIVKTGPLVAPSANIEGKPPAKTVREAQEYFGDNVDWYVDGARVERKPSRLVKILEGKPVIMRG
ncbi:MAG: L-threonylcarbamoyladenylate synthase [Patescibacteria group bacterium]|nr:L-threonylcarbamoyladenylate synthase [Patescibacteria group bacterium]